MFLLNRLTHFLLVLSADLWGLMRITESHILILLKQKLNSMYDGGIDEGVWQGYQSLISHLLWGLVKKETNLSSPPTSYFCRLLLFYYLLLKTNYFETFFGSVKKSLSKTHAVRSTVILFQFTLYSS